MSNFRLSEEEREKLEAIPEKEYAEQQIAWHEKQVEYWQNELKEIGEEESDVQQAFVSCQSS